MTPDFVAWLREELEKLHGKLDTVQEIQYEIRTTQAEQAKDIAHHIKRTDGLQEIVDGHNKWIERARGVAWFLGATGGVVGVVATVWSLALN